MTNYLDSLEFDINRDWKFDKLDFEQIWLELKDLEEKTLKNKWKELAPVYKDDIDKLSWKKLKKVVFLLYFAKKELWENFSKLFLEWQGVWGFKVEGLSFNDLMRFLDALAQVEAEKDYFKYKQIILTLEELKQLESIIKTEDEKDDIEFLKAQLEENVTSYEVLSNVDWFNDKLKEYLKKHCKSSNKKECSPEYVLNQIDNQFEKVLKTIMPENISADTLRNMATWFNIWMMLIYQDLPDKQKENFTSLISWLSELFEGEGFVDKIDGLVSTVEWAKLTKKFVKIYDFIRQISVRAKSLGLKTEDDWESLIDLNNPYKFAKLLDQYVNWNQEEQSKIIDQIFEDKIKLSTQQNWKIDIQSLLNRIKLNKETDDDVLNKLNNFSLSLDDNNIDVVLKLSEWVKKAWEYKEKIENKFEEIWNKLKKWSETIAKLLCIWQSAECKYSVEVMFYKILKFLSEILKSFGINIDFDWKLNNEFLEKFNKKFAYNFVKEFLKYDSNSKQYTLNSKIFKMTIFNDYLGENFKKAKFKNVKVSWSLSEETMKWLIDQGVNIDDDKSFQKVLIKIFSKEQEERFKNQPNIKEKIIKIFSKKDGSLVINLSELDLLLKEVYWYWDIIKSLYNQSEKQVMETLKFQPQIESFLKEKEIDFKNKVANLFPTIKNFSYIKYVNAIAKIESWGKYNIVNVNSWALGKYQFMPNTLKDYKNIICRNSNCNDDEMKENFLNNPLIQEEVMYEYTLNHLKQIANSSFKNKIKNEDDLVKLLAKAHFTWIGNLDKNYSDGKTNADQYALNALWNYKEMAA